MARVRVRQFKWYVCCEPDFIFRFVPGLIYWVPKIVKYAVVDGKWMDVSEPLFFDYFFVGTSRGWFYVEDMLGVELLRDSRRPHFLSIDEIYKIQQIENSQQVLLCMNFNPGQRVLVRREVRHPFSGLIGHFIRKIPVSGGEFAKIEINLFGQRKKIAQVPLDYLIPL